MHNRSAGQFLTFSFSPSHRATTVAPTFRVQICNSGQLTIVPTPTGCHFYILLVFSGHARNLQKSENIEFIIVLQTKATNVISKQASNASTDFTISISIAATCKKSQYWRNNASIFFPNTKRGCQMQDDAKLDISIQVPIRTSDGDGDTAGSQVQILVSSTSIAFKLDFV